MLNRRVLALCAVVVAVAAVGLSAPDVARAQRANPLIAQGQEQYDDLRFEEALQTLSAALVRAGNSQEQSRTIYRLLALTYYNLQRQEEAEGAWRSLLAINPDEQLTDVAPRVREFFTGVHTRWVAEGSPGVATRPPAPVTIGHRSPAQAERGTSVGLTATVDDPEHRVAHLVLAYRQGTAAVFRRVDTTPSAGGFRATIPGADVRPPLVEYYFEAVDAAGLPVGARGDVAAPLRIAVPAPGGGSILGKWWFWTIAAVVVAGAVVGTVLLVGGGGQDQRGTLVIQIR